MTSELTPDALNLLQEANAAFQQRDYENVVILADRLLGIARQRSDILNLRGMSRFALKQPEAASEDLASALQLESNSPLLHVNLATILADMCSLRQARGHALEAAKLAPHNAVLLYQSASILRTCGDQPTAMRLVDQCLRQNNRFADAWYLKGGLHLDLGNFTLAQQSLERAVTLEPRHAAALSSLISLRKESSANLEAVHLLDQIIKHPLDPDNRATAEFALADMYVRAGQPESAFACYLKANQHVHELNDPKMEAWLAGIDMTLASESQPLAYPLPSEPLRPQPVFIVGMPRSGTTLLEQILSNHSSILACGELTTINYLQARLLRQGVDIRRDCAALSAKQIEDCRRRYLDSLPPNAARHGWVIDKSMQNFERIGFILKLFPAARFIYCQRNPMDVVLSCFQQDFQRGLAWAFDLDSIARVYLAQDRIMKHWQGLYPDQILAFPYEEVVADLPGSVARLTEFLDINMQDAMLEPHTSRHAVNTASLHQVRKPLYGSSVNRWKKFARQLAPVAERFRAAGWEID